MNAALFRFARSNDASVITALIERAYRGPETAGQWDSESHLLTGPRTSVEEISGLIARPDSRFLLRQDQGRIIGCALIQQTAVSGEAYFQRFGTPGAAASGAEKRTGCYFGMFATDPATRAAGLGKELLAEAERRARDTFGAVAMVMTVINVRTDLIAWYERRGYRLTGGRVPFPFTATSGETTRDFDLVELRKDFT